MVLSLTALFPYPYPETSDLAAATAHLVTLVILAVFASTLSALLVYFIINPSPPEAKRQLALQTKTWASRPFTIAEETNYDSGGPHAPNLLVIRGVDDEAALALAFGAIATRINRWILGPLWKVALLLSLGSPFVQLVLILGGYHVVFGLDIESAISVNRALEKGLSTLSALLWAVIASLLVSPALFNGRFGREFLIGATRCEVAADSAPDSTRSRIITLQTP
jgi:hypothetical protein